MTRTIQEKGCVDCGCEHSTSWHHLPPKPVVAELYQQRCADCQGRHDAAGGQEQLPLQVPADTGRGRTMNRSAASVATSVTCAEQRVSLTIADAMQKVPKQVPCSQLTARLSTVIRAWVRISWPPMRHLSAGLRQMFLRWRQWPCWLISAAILEAAAHVSAHFHAPQWAVWTLVVATMIALVPALRETQIRLARYQEAADRFRSGSGR